MTDKLLPYYNDELQYLRNMAEEFSKLYPSIAGNLRVSGDAFDDPHVSRLMEAVAFLNARIACKLDDEFPELIDTLLNIIYPHYLSPFPSFSIIQLSPGKDMAEPYYVPRHTELETELFEEKTCQFRTCYSQTIYPFDVIDAKIVAQPFLAPANPSAENAQSLLQIDLRCTKEGISFSSVQPKTLQFYLNGLITHVLPLFELIFNNTISIGFAESANDKQPILLPPDVIRPIGFDKADGLLPYPSRSQLAYRILSEFFAFPNKFFFFEIDLLRCITRKVGAKFSLFFYFNNRNIELERVINKEAFLLGCTPIVNLFEQQAEPILLSHNRLEHRVVPDARQQKNMVVHEIISVKSIDSNGDKKNINPFYLRNAKEMDASTIFWSASRKPSSGLQRLTDVYLSLTSNQKILDQEELTLSVKALCSNGDLPNRLPFGGGHPRFNLVKGSGPLGGVACIFPPTNIILHHGTSGHKWRLLSHLNLNKLSLSDENSLSVLREILHLYDNDKGDIFRNFVEGIMSLEVKRGTARAPQYEDDPTWVDAICRGMDVHIKFDEGLYPGNSCYLFALILEKFFALYSTINSYTRLSYSIRGKAGIIKKWTPRVGYRYTL